ncbi:bifunctional aspartate kinase/homoserine dehydrogenase I [Chitinophaga nivalis]|uniref:Bifunctional aspartate kinase/homoserine dehydrogenase I n=1 Tax=Chitinophaga nivalis TaxID=2991709 RepID=A0ABT3IHK3_9BACT|nr:bifunctional aspartate kinase/homoserine dehydrogenase I [Chitinophaga nivalis]MCW3466872.1 bifunctional aspartate kinase/homoserine dehydrogenase I [Chitinophaga nivalis]MCW3483437.1 bifunctional aspartate kinase/homoserine dehydrogenase I [Chitinophaga nivalis]
MQVLKFGGTSVGSAKAIEQVCNILLHNKPAGRYAIVVSALGGITDKLIRCGQLAGQGQEEYKTVLQEIETRHLDTIRELFPITAQSSMISQLKRKLNALENLCDGIFQVGELSPRSLDKLMSYGELMSCVIVAAALKQKGLNAACKDSRELIITDDNFCNATVNFPATNHNIVQYFAQATESYTVLPGFVAATTEGDTTTLGRGGSDYTAAIVAAAVVANVLDIWTDVSGMMTADPRVVSQALPIAHISYVEAMELSHFGAKVIYPPTIQPVMEKRIPIWIKNTFAPNDYGTLIQDSAERSYPVTGISGIQHIALLTLEGSGMVGIPGFSKRLFEALLRERINVILITQSSSEHSITVGIHETDMLKAKISVDSEFAQEIQDKRIKPLQVEKDLSIVAVVGDNMKNHHGTSGKLFGSFGRNGINVRAIAQGSTEKNISAVINKADIKKALNLMHETFFEEPLKQVNLFVAGVGNVGSKLLEQLQQQQKYLQQELGLQIRVTGLANSRNTLLSEYGIGLHNWREQLDQGDKLDIRELVQQIKTFNLRNSVFVDNTASSEVAAIYHEFLEHGISIVTCNKIACSADYNYYKQLKDLARQYNASFLFETNVGAGLPVINTLNDLVRSGDKVHSIEAVLSGSLNFVFNHFVNGASFREVVKAAQDEGYTEPDPRIDLSGKDVMRKILILARESGAVMEMDEITNHSFLPEACLNAPSVADFYKELDVHADHFQQLWKDASAAGKRLKFVARYEEGKASVGLQSIAPDHPFYQLEGKDNIVLYKTSRYQDQPLIVKGAGAGADVTASGIFADIIRSARF